MKLEGKVEGTWNMHMKDCGQGRSRPPGRTQEWLPAETLWTTESQMKSEGENRGPTQALPKPACDTKCYLSLTPHCPAAHNQAFYSPEVLL